jgi:cell division protein FtsW
MRKLSDVFKGDRYIWYIVVILSCVGVLAVYSSTGALAFAKQKGNTEFYFLRHLIFLATGWGCMYFIHLIPFKFYSRISQIFFWVSVILLYATLFIGANINNAQRVIAIGSITFQPSDMAKVFLVMFVARYLSKNQETIDQSKTFRRILGMIAIVVIPILPENLSTALVVMTTSTFLLVMGRIKLKFIFSLIGIGILAFGLFVTFLFTVDMSNFEGGRLPTWKKRIETYIGKDEDGNSGYQQMQSKIAIATGGIIGKGPGNSTQRNFLPHPYSDFIFAIIVEEYGLIGGLIVIGCYIVLIFRCLKIVVESQRSFAALAVLGIGFSMSFQAFVHMGVSIGKLPVTGLTLPLVSMGGTSLILNSVAFGFILGISRHIQIEKEAEIKTSVDTNSNEGANE